MSNYVSTLIASGLDAFTNLYDIFITVPKNAIDIAVSNNKLTGPNGDTFPTDPGMITDFLKLRIGDFQGPQPKLAQYTTDFQTIQITRVAPMMEFERKFDLTFRVDTNYNLYHLLKQWSFLYHDALNGGIRLPKGNETDILGFIRVMAYASNTMSSAVSWGYNKVLCNKVTDPTYSRAGTEAATVTASFMFFEYLPPALNDALGKQLQGTLTALS